MYEKFEKLDSVFIVSKQHSSFSEEPLNANRIGLLWCHFWGALHFNQCLSWVQRVYGLKTSKVHAHLARLVIDYTYCLGDHGL